VVFVMPFPAATLEERYGADPFAIGHHHVAAALWAVGIEQAPIVWVSDPCSPALRALALAGVCYLCHAKSLDSS